MKRAWSNCVCATQNVLPSFVVLLVFAAFFIKIHQVTNTGDDLEFPKTFFVINFTDLISSHNLRKENSTHGSKVEVKKETKFLVKDRSKANLKALHHGVATTESAEKTTFKASIFTKTVPRKPQKLKIRVYSALEKLHYLRNNSRLCDDDGLNSGGDKVISYCIFGKDPWKKYGHELDRIAEDSNRLPFYKTWLLRIYHEGKYLSKETKVAFKHKYSNVFFCDIDKIPNMTWLHVKNARIWRFLAIADDSVDVTCSRDLDSPLLSRDADAVADWLNSTEIFHMMRDHRQHHSHVMAGMWCFRNHKNRNLGKQLLENMLRHSLNRSEGKEAQKDNDQVVLAKHLYPFIANDSLEHDAYWCEFYNNGANNIRAFPTRRHKDNWFIGGPRFTKPKVEECPKACRPKQHQDWTFC